MTTEASNAREWVLNARRRIRRTPAPRSAPLHEDALSVVAHDLKDPLGTILLAASVLLEVTPDSTERALERKQLHVIRRSTDRMLRLIQDLMDMAASDAGRLSISPVPVRPGIIVHDALELLQPIADAKGIALTALVAPDLPRINADRERMLQVLSNIGGNAIKFTPREGLVEIRVARRQACVEFAVRDSGPGISAPDLPFVFDRFWRSKAAGRHGTGLGLAIAKAIVQAHGGNLWVESMLSRGSLFRFTIPDVHTPHRHSIENGAA